MATQILKLVGADTYHNSRVGFAAITRNQTVRVTKEQAAMLHAVAEVFTPPDEETGEPPESWFREMAEGTKVDIDFTASAEEAANSSEPVAVVATMRKPAAQRVARKQ